MCVCFAPVRIGDSIMDCAWQLRTEAERMRQQNTAGQGSAWFRTGFGVYG